MLEQRIERQDPPLTVYPDEHKPLIAKLANERYAFLKSLMLGITLMQLYYSDKTAAVLAKHIRNELLPVQDDDDDVNNGKTNMTALLPVAVVEVAIKSVLKRCNYGLESQQGEKLPAALCVWRWEVKEEHRSWLPKAAREKADVRLAERLQVSLFITLDRQSRMC
jgi:hypothetical protein